MANILLIDDDPDIHRLVESFLEETIHDVQSALNIEAAVKIFGTGQSVDMILLDLNMPGMDGFAFLSRLRQGTIGFGIRRNTPVIVISGRGKQEDIARIKQLGASAYLIKPIRKDKLVGFVEAILQPAGGHGSVAAADQKVAILKQFTPYFSKSAFRHIVQTLVTRGIPAAIKKYMTIAFVDIVGFTALTERMGADATLQLLNAIYSVLHRTIHDHGGDIHKFMGDAMMLLFSTPDAAVRTLTDFVLRDIPNLNDKIQLPENYEISLHMGVNTGWVIEGELGTAARRDFTLIGDNVNIAARIQSNAPKNEIWISGRTYGELKTLKECFTEIESLKMKGKKQSIPLFSFAPEKLSIEKKISITEDLKKQRSR